MYKVQNSVEGHLSNVILRPKSITYHLKASDLDEEQWRANALLGIFKFCRAHECIARV